MKPGPLGVLGIWVLGIGIGADASAASLGKEGFPFLKDNAFARSAALGDATLARVGDLSCLSGNPAALAHLPGPQMSFQFTDGLVGSSYQTLAYGLPLPAGTLGFMAQYADFGSSDRTRADTSLGNTGWFIKNGTVKADNLLGSFTWAWHAEKNLTLGAGAKFLSSQLDKNHTFTALGDLGFLYRVNDQCRTAFAARNLGPDISLSDETSPAPMQFAAGVWFSPLPAYTLEFNAAASPSGSTEGRLGVEWSFNSYVDARLGYRRFFASDNLGGLTGFSAGLGLHSAQWVLDYAWKPFEDLGSTQWVTLSWKFYQPKPPTPAQKRPRKKIPYGRR